MRSYHDGRESGGGETERKNKTNYGKMCNN